MEFIKKIFKGIWNTLNFSRRLLVNFIFVLLIIAIVAGIVSDEGEVEIAEKSILKLNIAGVLVEELTYVDPLDAALGDAIGDQDTPKEMLVDDVIKVIKAATNDERIQAINLETRYMFGARLDKLKAVGVALEEFKASGKKVYAHSSGFNQSQYFLASFADEISLHPYGGVSISGYSVYPLYFKEALEKLKVTPHIFRVGTYKSAVEPYIRNDMSEAAKESNAGWLNLLWEQYKVKVAENRNFDTSNFDETLESLESKISDVSGDFGQYALQNQWVDALLTEQEFSNKLIEIVGLNNKGDSYNSVSFSQYLSTIKNPFEQNNPFTEKVAIVVAKGTINNGKRKAGSIGGDSTAALLRKARNDDKIKAVVLRIDSPGGSMFASEVIRNEVIALKEAGKPVVASMGSVAASGGYWIAASANEIWASPSTITGSIGVFGTVLTFENSIKSLGISSDGVSTTELNASSVLRGIDETTSRILQMGVKHSYQQFISLVADERNLEVEKVDEVAQGRVWLATQAYDFGLIDKLGTKQEAIEAAAKLANLEIYDVVTVKQNLTEQEQLMQQIFGSATMQALLSNLGVTQDPLTQVSQDGISLIKSELNKQIRAIQNYNDPNHIYSICYGCEVSE